MIKKEKVTIDKIKLIKIYSDEGFEIRQKETGNVYGEVLDPVGSNFTYEELDTKVPTIEEPQEEPIPDQEPEEIDENNTDIDEK